MPETSSKIGEGTARDLFEQHYRSIVLLFVRRGFPEHEAQDLAQETFMRMFRVLGNFDDATSARSYLFAIATNVWKNEVRRRHAQQRRGVDDESVVPALDAELTTGADAPDALRQVLDQEQRNRLALAVQGLPPQMRRAISLRLVGNLRYREIAAVMQISIDAVKSHLAQARTRLREELRHTAEDFDEER